MKDEEEAASALVRRVVVEVNPDADASAVEAELADLARGYSKSVPPREDPDARVTRVADPETLKKLLRKQGSAEGREALERLERRRVVRFLSDADLRGFVEAARKITGVDAADVEPEFTSPAGDCSVTVVGADDYVQTGGTFFQKHLQPAPQGVDARYAWTRPGGDGCGVGIGVVERRWSTTHKDLVNRVDTIPNANFPASAVTGESPSDVSNSKRHGANTLGVVLARDGDKDGDGKGPCTGVAPNPRAPLIGSHLSSSVWAPGTSEPDAVKLILDLADNVPAPVVVLVELQIGIGAPDINLPIECWSPVFDAIKAAYGAGVFVIEPAGNDPGGTDGLDLDAPAAMDAALISAAGCTIPSNDSGAIVVMAAAGDGSAGGFAHRSDSNKWARAACYAPGDDVITTGIDDSIFELANSYSHTSAASAVIAGVALCLVGVSRQRGQTLSVDELRKLLRNEDGFGNRGEGSFGTEVKSSSTGPVVGSVPDMRAILGRNFGRADVFIRDSLTDQGVPVTQPVFPKSPDILIHWKQELKWPGNIPWLPWRPRRFKGWFDAFITVSREQSIRVRVHNRGPVAAQNVKVDLYVGGFGTVFDASSMKAGTLTVGMIPANASKLSTSLALPKWVGPGRSLSALAVAGATGDPAPELPSSPADYLKFLGAENNAAARAFVLIPLPLKQLIAPIPFQIRGFDKPTENEISVVSSLPAAVKVSLEGPRSLIEAWKDDELYDPSRQHDDETAQLRLPRRGPIGRLIVHRKQPVEVKLVFDAPLDLDESGEITIVQRWQGQIVGGVSVALDQVSPKP